MSERFLYLTVDIACLIVPLCAAFHSKYPFNREWKSLLPAIGITAMIFIAWDAYFTGMGVWRFNPRYLTGLYLFNLPIEEIAFFICIPYPCLFLFYCIERYIRPRSSNLIRSALFIAAGTSFVVAGLNASLIYTFCTFLLLGVLLIALALMYNDIAPSFLIAFGIAFLPFFISNGILTGLWTEEPVVIYNDRENLRIRMATIPVEDLFYGMSFQLLNVLLFMRFRNASRSTSGISQKWLKS